MSEFHRHHNPGLFTKLMSMTIEDGDCAVWTGSTKAGSPSFGTGSKMVRRMLHEARTGQPVKGGQFARMSCGNSLCVSVEHTRFVSLASHRSSMAKVGWKNPAPRMARMAVVQQAKSRVLDWDKVRDIRACESATEAARKHNISISMASKIKRNECWREGVPGASVFYQRV